MMSKQPLSPSDRKLESYPSLSMRKIKTEYGASKGSRSDPFVIVDTDNTADKMTIKKETIVKQEVGAGSQLLSTTDESSKLSALENALVKQILDNEALKSQNESIAAQLKEEKVYSSNQTSIVVSLRDALAGKERSQNAAKNTANATVNRLKQVVQDKSEEVVYWRTAAKRATFDYSQAIGDKTDKAGALLRTGDPAVKRTGQKPNISSSKTGTKRKVSDFDHGMSNPFKPTKKSMSQNGLALSQMSLPHAQMAELAIDQYGRKTPMQYHGNEDEDDDEPGVPLIQDWRRMREEVSHQHGRLPQR